MESAILVVVGHAPGLSPLRQVRSKLGTDFMDAYLDLNLSPSPSTTKLGFVLEWLRAGLDPLG